MTREVKLNNCQSVLEELEYPAAKADAEDEFSDVTVLFADGESNLSTLISQTTRENFDSVSELETELHNVLPREAVGEPFQSEGDA